MLFKSCNLNPVGQYAKIEEVKLKKKVKICRTGCMGVCIRFINYPLRCLITVHSTTFFFRLSISHSNSLTAYGNCLGQSFLYRVFLVFALSQVCTWMVSI